MQICIDFAENLQIMDKEKRQQALLELIRSHKVSTQEQLVKFLEEAGFSVTQSSVSRDLDELGIYKKGGFYVVPEPEDAEHGFLGLETAGENLIVASCASGMASAVAVRIDKQNIPEIVGTVAGDDTVFIAVKNRDDQKVAIRKIWEIFGK
ncbi:MAG: hypothetical protein N2Z23_06805 [Pyrinomonadaceae bacterium]|nr:hypothetical protein [Pyrinomonadaceae bacterium]MCX7640133.1 hypothetical protein [Pyrinomonadaceae bacterium]MDW8303279.1 arginine repressor [Acidobacteriota bacterium]